MITIIDYGVGNLASVQNMLKSCGFQSHISSSADDISVADKLILPGVGAFDSAIGKIDLLGLRDPIHSASKRGTLILGICLGAQLLLDESEEGKMKGLSLIRGRCKKFDAEKISPLKVPHMGWSEVCLLKKDHALSNFEEDSPRFYFSHSYYMCCEERNRFMSCHYGIDFTCGIALDNIIGVQFHPEKSHTFGARLLTSFARM